LTNNGETFKLKLDNWLNFCIAYIFGTELKKQKEWALRRMLLSAHIYEELELVEKQLMEAIEWCSKEKEN